MSTEVSGGRVRRRERVRWCGEEGGRDTEVTGVTGV